MNARYRFWVSVAVAALVVYMFSLMAAVWQVLHSVWSVALGSPEPLDPLWPWVCTVAMGMFFVAVYMVGKYEVQVTKGE